MKTARRILFLLPEAEYPSGGVNVLMDMASQLHIAGFDARLVYASSGFQFGFHASDAPVLIEPALSQLLTPLPGWVASATVARVYNRLNRQTKLSAIGPDDLIVVPEYMYPDLPPVLDQHACIVVAQDVMGFARAFSRDRHSKLARAHAVITTSNASDAAVRSVSSIQPKRVTLAVGRPGLEFNGQKKRQIACMPRKRRDHAEFLARALSVAPDVQSYDFVSIKRLAQDALDRVLSESLIFIALSHEEGFGLPPAEAMLAGCIVVGYDGVGGAEYFNERTGIVIPDSDLIGLFKAVEHVARDYETNPAPYDELRRTASEHIARTYPVEAFRKTVLQAFADIENP